MLIFFYLKKEKEKKTRERLPFFKEFDLCSRFVSRKEISCVIEIRYLIGSCSKNTQKTILKRYYNEADSFMRYITAVSLISSLLLPRVIPRN